MKKQFFIIMTLLLIGVAFFSFQEMELMGDGEVYGTETLRDDTNPHYNEKYCIECHDVIPEKRSDARLRFEGDLVRLCRCHYNTQRRCPHPSDVPPSKEIKARIPTSLPLTKGRVVCTTCHDVYFQCRDSRVDRMFPQGNYFLRADILSAKSNLCFKCHNKEKFAPLNPHKQLHPDGEIMVERCLYCHVEKPDEKTAGYKDVRLVGDFEMLCVRCHSRVKANRQSLHAIHIRKPSPAVAAKIRESELKYDTVLPLDMAGKVTCVTCHNPHEKGVIPPEKPAAKGAGERFKQRTPGNMCIACHIMQGGPPQIRGGRM